MEHKESIGDMAHRLKKMVSQPASKEWFEKHGLPGKKKEMASKMNAHPKPGTPIGKTKEGKIILAKPRHLTPEESREKTKNWPKGGGMGNNPSEKFKADHQKRTGRAYSE